MFETFRTTTDEVRPLRVICQFELHLNYYLSLGNYWLKYDYKFKFSVLSNCVLSDAHDRAACNLQLFSLKQSWGSFRTPILCPNVDKKESKLHERKNARATLHPNKQVFLLKKPQLWTRDKRFKVMIFWYFVSVEVNLIFTVLVLRTKISYWVKIQLEQLSMWQNCTTVNVTVNLEAWRLPIS